MAPENIHLNLFMYEPLMDMPIHPLVELFTRIENLQCPEKQQAGS